MKPDTHVRRCDLRTTHLPYRVVALMIAGVIPLHAYADPGNGLLIWQIVGAFFVGCVYQVRKVLVSFRKRK
jgi:hypothetical protein